MIRRLHVILMGTIVGLVLSCSLVWCGCDEAMTTLDLGEELLGTTPQKCSNVLAGEYELSHLEDMPYVLLSSEDEPDPNRDRWEKLRYPLVRGQLVITPDFSIYMRLFKGEDQIRYLDGNKSTYELYPKGMCNEGTLKIMSEDEEESLYFDYILRTCLKSPNPPLREAILGETALQIR